MASLGKMLLSCFFAGLLTAAAADATEVRSSHPRHISEGASRSTHVPISEPRPTPQSLVNPLPTSNLLFDEEARSLRDYRYEPELSRACRERRFLQVRDRMFIVRLKGMTYGAALGGHWSLFDPTTLARPSSLYVISNQDSARCQVYLVDGR